MQQEVGWTSFYHHPAKKRIYQEYEMEDQCKIIDPEIDNTLKRNKLIQVMNTDMRLGPLLFGKGFNSHEIKASTSFSFFKSQYPSVIIQEPQGQNNQGNFGQNNYQTSSKEDIKQ